MSEALSLFERLGAYVLTWSWQMAVLVLFAWMAVKLDRRHRPALRHHLWVLTLLFGLLLPWIPERIAAQSWTQQVRQVLQTPVAASLKSEVQDSGRALVVPVGVADKAQAVSVPHAVRPTFADWNSSRTTLLQAAGLFWAIGVVFAAFRRMREYWRLRRIASNAHVIAGSALTRDTDASTPPILLSPDIRSPMLYGWFHPVILLPEDVAKWSTPDERATMIRHESVHFARKDHWVSAFEALVRTVCFFHPLVRWTCRQVDIERELACDEEVLRRGAEPAIYAEAILRVAEHAVAGRAACGVYFAATGQLDRRVDMLFRTPTRVARSAVLLVPAFVLLAPMVALGFWQARVEIPAPIEFRIDVNPIGLIPEKLLAPAPRPIPIAAVTPLPVRSQNPPANPAVTEPTAFPRVNVAFLKVTEDQVMANITLGLPHSQLVFKEDILGQAPIRRAIGRFEGLVTNLTGKRIQPLDSAFEIVVPAAGFSPADMAVHQKTLFLRPGLYKLSVLVTDSNGGIVGTLSSRLEVPRFSLDKLSASSLILADLLESVPPPTRAPEFRIGNFWVRSNISEFRRDQDLSIYQEVYVPDRDVASTRALLMETLITLDGREIKRVSEVLQRSERVAVTKKIPLADFTTGGYTVQTTYTDTNSGQQVVSTGQFSVKQAE